MTTLKIESREQFEAWLHNKTVPSYTRDGEYRPHIRNSDVEELYDALRPRWVPVSNPPEKEDFYLCVIKERDCRYQESVLWCTGSGWDFIKAERITHWMLLPPLPEES